MALLARVEVEVCCYVADVDEYTPLACTVHSDAITGDLLIFVVCHCCCCKLISWFQKVNVWVPLASNADGKVHKDYCERQASWCYAVAAMSPLLHDVTVLRSLTASSAF